MTNPETRPTSPPPVWRENAASDRRWPSLRFSQIWRHRELAIFFAVRDVKVRYKQAYLGVAWAGLQPLAGAMAFTFVFNRLADIDVGSRSYFAFALVGFAVWSYFSASLSTGSNSLVYNANLLTKIAFPRVVIPLAALLPGLIDFAVGAVLACAAAVLAGDGVHPVTLLLTVPVGVVMMLATSAGLVLCFGAMIVRFRDVGVIVGFGLQVLLFASPVGYPPELVANPWRTLLYVNPLSGCLGLLRAGLVGTPLPSAVQLLLSGAVAFLLFVGGLAYFRRHEREFADII